MKDIKDHMPKPLFILLAKSIRNSDLSLANKKIAARVIVNACSEYFHTFNRVSFMSMVTGELNE